VFVRVCLLSGVKNPNKYQKSSYIYFTKACIHRVNYTFYIHFTKSGVHLLHTFIILLLTLKIHGGNIKMKKTIAIVLTCLMALTMLAACGGSENPADDQTPGNPPLETGPGPANPPAATPDPAATFDKDRVIAVFTREDGSGTRSAFIEITGVGDDMYVEAVVQNETAQILTSVETNETGIGYVSVGSLSSSVKALTIDGIMPSNETIMDGTYSLQRPFLVAVTAEKQNDPLVKDFIDFMLSIEGQELSARRNTEAVTNPVAYTPGGLSGVIKVGGSTSVEPLMQLLREAYIAHNPGVEIEISGGGSGTGINEATSGVLDIGMSSRNLREAEKEALTDIAIALDGVAVIVNIANPLEGLSIEVVREIFVGEKTRWNQIG